MSGINVADMKKNNANTDHKRMSISEESETALFANLSKVYNENRHNKAPDIRLI